MTETPGPVSDCAQQKGNSGTGAHSVEGPAPALVFTIPQPPSVNSHHYYGTRARTKEYRDWALEAGWEITRQGPSRQAHLGKRVRITYEFGKTRKDLDNMMKAISDLLKRCAVITDDRTKYVRGYSVDLRERDVKPGCVRVTVGLCE